MTRPRSALRATALVVALLTCASLTPVAAAAIVHTDDATGDVWEALYDNEGNQIGWSPAGSPGNADVIATDARHGKHRIVFTTHFADLARGPRQSPFINQERMAFDHGPGVTVEVFTSLGWHGRSFLFSRVTGNRVRCPELRHEIDYAADTVKVWVPRSCVHHPRWVRYSAIHTAFGGEKTPTLADDHLYFDNGLNGTHRSRVNDANLSDRVRRG